MSELATMTTTKPTKLVQSRKPLYVTGTINVIGTVMSEIDCLIAGNLQ